MHTAGHSGDERRLPKRVSPLVPVFSVVLPSCLAFFFVSLARASLRNDVCYTACAAVFLCMNFHDSVSSGISRVQRSDRSVRPVAPNDLLHELSAFLVTLLLSKPAVLVFHFFGVAVIRMYPAMNAAGVDLASAIRVLLFHFPLTCLALGALAFIPPTIIGTYIKHRLGFRLVRYPVKNTQCYEVCCCRRHCETGVVGVGVGVGVVPSLAVIGLHRRRAKFVFGRLLSL